MEIPVFIPHIHSSPERDQPLPIRLPYYGGCVIRSPLVLLISAVFFFFSAMLCRATAVREFKMSDSIPRSMQKLVFEQLVVELSPDV